MTYNFNGELREGNQLELDIHNRALHYGDGLFESLRYAGGRINFWEDHYFRLMASMRILRMEIPMHFSPEFLENEMRKTVAANGWEREGVRLKILVWRSGAGRYTPETNAVEYLISAEVLESPFYPWHQEGLRIDLFPDYYKPQGLLANLKSTASQLYTVASVFRAENDLDECILLNAQKEVCEAISANLFMIQNEVLYTPPLESGCLKGVMRKKLLELAQELGWKTQEKAFSPFALQKAEEVFLSNAISGIRWVRQYRKKTYGHARSEKLYQQLKVAAALNSN